MEEQEVTKIMNEITKDENLCIVREALRQYSPKSQITFITNFVNDYCKSEEDRKEFWEKFHEHIDFVSEWHTNLALQ